MDDLISRQAAIDALRTCYDTETITMDNGDEYINYEDAVGEIEQLPPAQPQQITTQLTADDVETIRIHLSAIKGNLCNQHRWNEAKEYEALIDRLTVQPEQRTGRWIPQDHNKRVGNISTCVYYYPICSKCGKVGNDTYKYCPHCGAKMEGANNETD